MRAPRLVPLLGSNHQWAALCVCDGYGRRRESEDVNPRRPWSVTSTGGRVRVVVVALGSLLMLTSCGGGTDDALTPLDVIHRLEEAKIPCDEPALDRREAQDGQLGLSDLSVSRPAQTLLTCGALGGPYQIAIWDSADATIAALKNYCLQNTLMALYSDQGIEYRTDLPNLDRPDLGVGSNWMARATKGSIVSTTELAQAIDGAVTSLDALCSPYASDAEALVASEQQRLTIEAAAKRKLQDDASLEAALSDPARALIMANSETASASMLMRLAHHSDDFRVGCTLAKNPNLPTEAFAELAGRAYRDILLSEYRGQVGVCVAGNERTPLEVLQIVAVSQYKDARQAAKAAIAKRG